VVFVPVKTTGILLPSRMSGTYVDPRHHRGAGSDRHRPAQPPRIDRPAPGENSIRPVAAALANAIFDATGVRLRRAPLTSERLKPALA
jgi:hypothetical protein